MLTHVHPFRRWFTCRTSSQIMGSGSPSSKSGPVPEPPSAQSPLPASGVTSGSELSCISSEGVTPPSSLIRLMRQTKFLLPTSVVPSSAGLCRLRSAPAGRWPFPTLSPQSVLRRLDPYPAASPWACSFCSPTYFKDTFPKGHRPHHRGAKFGTLDDPGNATSTGNCFSGRQSFANVQAP